MGVWERCGMVRVGGCVVSVFMCLMVGRYRGCYVAYVRKCRMCLSWLLAVRFVCWCVAVVSLENRIGSVGAAAIVSALRANPRSLTSLSGLYLCYVDSSLPLELRHASNGSILDYYRDLLSAPVVVSRRCRVMLLGAGGVGKTTLENRLVTGTPATVVADVTHGALQRKCCDATCSIGLGLANDVCTH